MPLGQEQDIRGLMSAMLRDKRVFDLAVAAAHEYMEGLEARPVFPTPRALAELSAFDGPLPDGPGDGAEIIGLLREKGSPATVAQTGGRYFGFVDGGAVPVAVAAKWLASVWDQNAALYLMSPLAAKLEQVCEAWIADLLGLPEGTAAGLVTGSSVAIFCGLAAGRNELLRRMGWDVAARGLFEAPRLRVVLGEQAHATVFKSLSLLGLGAENAERVPVDGQGRMDPARLPALDETCLLVLQAGNVNSGSFDPLAELCAAAKQAGAWVHVDGAFGLWAAASRRHAHLTRGLELADSWSVDAHKTLNTPYDCGLALCRRREALSGAMQAAASYIIYGQNRDNMLLTPDMSRRGRAVELWATLKFLGREGVAQLVDGLCDRADQLAQGLRDAGFRVLNEVVFNQVLAACRTPDLTRRTLAAVQAGGECWAGGAQWRGEDVIRLSVSSWATTPADVDRTVEAFALARDRARREC